MRKKQHPLFVSIGVLMIIAGTSMILYRVTGDRIGSSAAMLLVTGFTSAAVGAMLLTRSPTAVFFYALFSLSALFLHATATSFLHPLNLLPLVMLLLTIPLIKALPRRQR